MGMTHDLTALQVQVRDSEITPITITRAGIYKLVKLLVAATGDTLDTVVYNLSCFNKIYDLCGNCHYNYDKIISDIRKVLFPNGNINGHLRNFDFDIKNSKCCMDRKWHFKTDCFELRGNYYPRRWRKYLRRCEDCGEIYFDQLEIEADRRDGIISQIYYKDIGYDGRCVDCLDSRYVQCADCSRIIDKYNSDYAVIDGDYICDDCLHSGDYCCCDYCGEWFRCDSDDAQFAGDNCYCSSDCCENDGWHWSSRREEWVGDDDDYEDNEVDEIIPDYHSHCVDINFVGEMDKRQKHWLGGGTETEVDGLDRYDYSYDYFSNLWDMFGGSDYCYFEQDGSVEFEIISQPMTEKEFFNYDWETPFNKLMADGWKSHDTTTCGRHFHYSKWYLGYTPNQRHNNAKKICRFFQIFAEDIKKIARRDFNHYTMDLRQFNRGEAIDETTDYWKLSNDRYWAVNLTNLDKSSERKGTIEIRICKGTLKASTTRASFDIFLHIVRNAKNISWKNINNLKLWLKGIKRQETIDYIKSRHAFSEMF